MLETPEDLRDLQTMLDYSYASAGAHLRSIMTEPLRIAASELTEILRGVQVLAVATVTGRCEPRVGAVDGLFYRGRWHFGSSPDSVRFRHLRRRPQVSATHTRGESLAVVVHGTATPVAPARAEHAEFRAFLLDVYGGDWADWGEGAAYARIDPVQMFASRLPGAVDESAGASPPR